MKKILGLCLLLILSLASCYIDSEEQVQADITAGHKQSAAPGDRMALLIVTDGLRMDILQSMMDAGEAPNFKKYIYDRAAASSSAFTSSPGVTYSNLATMVTGQYGSHSGVAGMKYMYRRELQFRDYTRYSDLWKINDDCTSPTLMEVLKDQYTFVNLFPLYRGSDHYARMFYNTLRAHVFERWDLNDAACCANIAKVYEYCRKPNRYPRFSVMYIIGTDHYAHIYGAESQKFRDYVKFVDANLGMMFDRLEKVGVLKDMLVVHVSDHGHIMVKDKMTFNLLDAMSKDLGIKGIDGSIPNDLAWKEKVSRYNDCNAIVIASSDRYGYVYLSSEPPNKYFTANLFAEQQPLERIRHYEISPGRYVDLVASVLKYDAVEHALARKGENMVAVFHRDGEAEVERKILNGRKMYRYKVVSGKDPFGYDGSEKAGKMNGDAFYTADEWLAATCDTEFPDAVVQSIEVFDSKDSAGDLIVYGRMGYDFNRVQKGAHGGMHRVEMRIPFAFAGPGIKKGEIGPVRSVDVMPTILDYLGFKDRREKLKDLDGESLFDRIAEPAKPRNAQP
jgi:hypothetical protein